MKLCLRCRHLWPSGSLYCPRCQASFGVRLCPNGHPNPAGGRVPTCIVCNAGPLTPAVPFLPLGGLTRLLSLVLLLVLARLLWPHIGQILCLLLRTGLWSAAFVANTTPCAVFCNLFRLVVWYGVLWLLSGLLPPKPKSAVRQGMQTALRQSGRMLRLFGQWLRRML